MKKKMLLLDMDGTALNDEKQLTEGNRKAINEAFELGHRIVVTTGRPLRSARLLAKRYDLDRPGSLIVAYNGGIIFDVDREETVFKKTIALNTVREVFAKAASMGVHIQTYRNEKVFVDTANDDNELKNYCRIIEMESEVVPDIGLLDEEPAKMHSSLLEHKERLVPFRDWINASYKNELESFLSSPMFLEIVPCGVNKGMAVHKLSEIFDWPIEDIIAVGDEANDIPMIREAGIGAAMANGIDDIKAAADYITATDNNHDGVAEVIRKFMTKQDL